jgi:hypothetical protein
MTASRSSGATYRNTHVVQASAGHSNVEWLRSVPAFATPGAVLLLGGVSVVDFRLRVAQSHLRHDLLPSFWSNVGIIASADTFFTVPLDELLEPTRVPARNAIHECGIDRYDDAERYPNIGIVKFADAGEAIVAHVRRLMSQRGAVDLPQLLVAWLGFAWGTGAAVTNPLTQGVGMPGAALVETAFGMGGIELTPGVASAASCPEAVWQSAIWWHEYYEKTKEAPVDGQPDARPVETPGEPRGIVPAGAYVTRQPAAAVAG